MRDEENNPLTGGCRWIVVDEFGEVQAVITGCKKLAHAQRIADLPGIRALAWFGQLDYKQRHEAEQAYRITPRICERPEIAPPPNPLRRTSTLEDGVRRLRKRFPCGVGGGQ